MKNNDRDFDQILATMKDSGGLTRQEMASMVNINKFFKYCIERFGDRPRYFPSKRKYHIAASNEDHEEQCRFLGAIHDGIRRSVVKQAEYVANTTSDIYVRELGCILGIVVTPRSRTMAR